jgi:signal transduction histidine kinase
MTKAQPEELIFWNESALVQSWSHLYFRVDLAGEVQAVSRGVLQLLERSEADLLGRAFVDFICAGPILEECSVETPFPLELRLENDLTYKTDFICNRSDRGSVFLGSRSMVADNETDSEMTYVEQELAAVNRNYQKTLEELKVTEEKLLHSAEEFQQFAYVASHDLNEPLRTIKSYLELIQRRYKDNLDEDGNEFLQFAVEGALRMKRMVDGLLVLSRIETQGHPFEDVPASSLAEAAVLKLKLRIRECSAQVMIEDDLPTVHVDSAQVGILFQTLLDNALKFQSGSTPEVHIGATRRDDRFWQFHIRDNGIGIAPENREKVFGLFKRLHGQSEFEGSGLGLALCRKIVERQGGQIWVESVLGEGSTFYFTIPAEKGRN